MIIPGARALIKTKQRINSITCSCSYFLHVQKQCASHILSPFHRGHYKHPKLISQSRNLCRAVHAHPCQFPGRSCPVVLTQMGLLGALECLVHAAASGPTSNSFVLSSNLIRPLNGFSAQPFSASTATPHLHPPHLSPIFLITIFHSFSYFPLSISLSRRSKHKPTSLFLFSSASSPLRLARFVFLSHSLFRVPVLWASCFHPFFLLFHRGHQLWFVRDLLVGLQTPDSHSFLLSPH